MFLFTGKCSLELMNRKHGENILNIGCRKIVITICNNNHIPGEQTLNIRDVEAENRAWICLLLTTERIKISVYSFHFQYAGTKIYCET